MEVTLAQMLQAREQRVLRQTQLVRQFGRPLVSFSMNIPGPVKNTPLIQRGFRAGCRELDRKLSRVLHKEIYERVTGCEAIYVVDDAPTAIKTVTTAIEDSHGLGRLFDMDVIGTDLCKLDRETVGGGGRNCIVCGAPGRGCASRRIQSVSQLQNAVLQILTDHFRSADALRIGDFAVQSLLDEAETTPKPGLVDCRNSGSHRDMDIFTFRASAAALAPYYRSCAAIGMAHQDESPDATFLRLRQEGLNAEQAMYAATGGVNTHKGAIFTLGILCGAAGRLWKADGTADIRELFREVSAMTASAMAEDRKKAAATAGDRLYAQYGIAGIRGEAAGGLPSVEHLGLPVFTQCLNAGMDKNRAGVDTLLHLIARVTDTNMIHRGGMDGARAGADACAALLARDYTLADVEALDAWFTERNLSPGGCADLLAAVYFVHALAQSDFFGKP